VRCKYCGSENTIKRGRVNGKQFHSCKECGHAFLDNGTFPKMRIEQEIIVTALNLYFDGLSVWKVKRQMAKVFKVKVSQMTVWKWVIKYSRLVNEFISTLKPQLSGVWQADETTVNCRSKNGDKFKWFWQIIDAETRWIVATHLSGDRSSEEAIKLFKKSLELAKVKPETILTDGWWTYERAYRKVFWTRYKAERPEYVRSVGIRSGNTNKVERLHGTLKDRTKAMRGFKKEQSCEAILNGWRIYYNLLKPHISLNGKTPAQASEIELPIENGWGDLIQIAINYQTKNGKTQKA